MSGIRRRDALKTLGGLAGAATMARFLPACGSGDDGPVGITTYVFMMMENRSYDHYFGARSLVEGLPGDGLTEAMTNPTLDGRDVGPFAASRDQLCDPDPPHGWDAAHRQWNNGANDGFLRAHQQSHGNDPGAVEPMKYMTREVLPVSWALADEYTVCDRWFSSVMGPTWPNRFYWHSGTSGGIMSNELPNGGIDWPSINERLHEAGIDWRYYFGSLPVLSILGDRIPTDGKILRFSQFLKDAAAGTLPPVTHLDPAFFANDDHPPVHPINGQELIAAVYTALAQSPQWKNCLLVITYDENGGYFDHVPPPKTADEFAAQGFDQLGFRVPTLVVGPYVKQGHVSSVTYDHTSALKHLETAFALPPLTARVSAANDLMDCIDLERLARGDWAKPVEIPVVDVTQWEMPPICNGEEARAAHPILAWAHENPHRIDRYERPDPVEERRAIRDHLRQAVTRSRR